MGKIDGQHIKFGTHKVELGKSDGVKKETVVKQGDTKAESIFNRYDSNQDGILDKQELKQLYTDLQNAAGNKRLSKSEARAFAAGSEQLDNSVTRDDLQAFVSTLASEQDGLSADWDGNKYTVVDGNVTTIKEYADDDHEQLSTQIVKNGNSTTVTNYENGVAKTKETTIGSGDNITGRAVETYADDGKTVVKTEKYGPGGQALVQTTEKDGDNTVITDYGTGGKPAKKTVKDAQGNETVTTYEWAEDGSHTETTNGVVKRFDKDGNEIPETVTPETKQHKVQSGENWYKIVQAEYGVTDHATTMEIVHQLKDLAGPKYGKEVKYGSSSMPREITLPTTVKVGDREITLTNPPEAVAAAPAQDAAAAQAQEAAPAAEEQSAPVEETSIVEVQQQHSDSGEMPELTEIRTLAEELSLDTEHIGVEKQDDGKFKVTVGEKVYTGTIAQIKTDIQTAKATAAQSQARTYTLETDPFYEALTAQISQLDESMRQFESAYNITRGDIRSELNGVGKDGYSEYSSNSLIYKQLQRDESNYKQVMSEWQDGQKLTAYTRSINGQQRVDYTNIERITLSNGQRAYRTDQGTFYPGTNGMPGSQPVPEELLAE